MKNIVTFAICILFATISYAQSPAEEKYSLEIWDVQIFTQNGFSLIEIDVFNSGDTFLNPYIQVAYDDILIVNPDKKEILIDIQPLSIHKFELSIDLPSSFDGKKIKLDIIVGNKEYTLTEKFKVKIN